VRREAGAGHVGALDRVALRKSALVSRDRCARIVFRVLSCRGGQLFACLRAGRSDIALRGRDAHTKHNFDSRERDMMLTRSTLIVAVVAVLGLASAGCGGNSGSPAPNNGAAGNGGGNNAAGSNSTYNNNPGNGITACGDFPDGPKSCQAGQYCSDQTFSRCEAGCLSDTNCASNQTCQKASGATTGSCQNKPTSTDCGPVCDRILPCETSLPRNTCLQLCAGFNEACKQCILGANCNNPEACEAACDF